MIKEAVGNFNGQFSYSDIKKYIKNKWTDVNEGTITDQIILLSVNHKSRIHYGYNKKIRLTNSNSSYDLLFKVGRGQLEKYDSNKHGVWEIFEASNKKFGIRKFETTPISNTFLFAWNPDKWNWETLEQNIAQLRNGGKVSEAWNCASYKAIKPGDRAFLVRLGSEPRGIFAAGHVSSQPFSSKHWSGEDADIYQVFIDFEVLLNPAKEPILTIDTLKEGNLEKQHWTPQSSGISINPELVDKLEEVWFRFLIKQSIGVNPYAPSEGNKSYIEGTANEITQIRYERNPYARATCINCYGYSCSVCEFDFEKCFGELGKNFIHVHHLTQIATVGKAYQVDPIKDLRPVCPNCHAMLHKQNPPLTIDELKMWLA